MHTTLAPLLLVLFLGGCGGGWSGARNDFKTGHYGAARERLVALEAASKDYPPAEQARYCLYRGLTHHALGDRMAAADWLGRAKHHEDTTPRILSSDDLTRLQLALESLGADVAP